MREGEHCYMVVRLMEVALYVWLTVRCWYRCVPSLLYAAQRFGHSFHDFMAHVRAVYPV